jgi:hypothetical protein
MVLIYFSNRSIPSAIFSREVAYENLCIYNIPIILKIVLKNILFRKKWVSDDMQIINKEFEDKTIIVKSVDMGYKEIEKSFY